jgi:hypothetical protein
MYRCHVFFFNICIAFLNKATCSSANQQPTQLSCEFQDSAWFFYCILSLISMDHVLPAFRWTCDQNRRLLDHSPHTTSEQCNFIHTHCISVSLAINYNCCEWNNYPSDVIAYVSSRPFSGVHISCPCRPAKHGLISCYCYWSVCTMCDQNVSGRESVLILWNQLSCDLLQRAQLFFRCWKNL